MPGANADTYDAWVNEALGIDPAKFSGQAGATIAKAGPARDLMVRITAAQNLLDVSLNVYRSTKAGAQATADMTGPAEDPGPKIEKLAAAVNKTATAATAAIKKGDVATATKLVSSIETGAHGASGLASSYAAAVDKANVDGAAKEVAAGKDPYYESAAEREVEINTPWGKLRILSLQAASVSNWVLHLSEIPEGDKAYAAKYQAAIQQQQEAVKPMAEYLASPAKMEAEIKKAASIQAVNSAELANVNEEVAELKDIFNDNLISQLENAKVQWQMLEKQIDASALKEKAAKLRAKAEEAEKLVDLGTDLFKAGVELLSNPAHGAAHAAAEVFTGALKFFYESDLKKQAEDAEKDADSLNVSALNEGVERAKKATDELQKQMDKIGPLGNKVASSIQRNVSRATDQLDKDLAAKGFKFRFSTLLDTTQKALPLQHLARNAANERYRNVWAAAGALLDGVKLNLGQYDKDGKFGHSKNFKFDQGLSWNRSVLDAIAAYIQQNSTQCFQQARESGNVVTSLLELNSQAFEALKRAHLPA